MDTLLNTRKKITIPRIGTAHGKCQSRIAKQRRLRSLRRCRLKTIGTCFSRAWPLIIEYKDPPTTKTTPSLCEEELFHVFMCEIQDHESKKKHAIIESFRLQVVNESNSKTKTPSFSAQM